MCVCVCVSVEGTMVCVCCVCALVWKHSVCTQWRGRKSTSAFTQQTDSEDNQCVCLCVLVCAADCNRL